MKKWTVLIAALMLAFFCGAAAQEKDIGVYVSPGCLTEDTELALVQLLSQAYGEAEFTRFGDEAGTLWQRVMDGNGPHLVICTAQEAARCAKEGLLLPLDVDEQEERIAKEVLSACTHEGELFMAPLYARHRRMGVNQRKMEELQIAALMDERVFPVWQPMQLYQVLEEAALADGLAMELWPCSGEDGDAPLAFMQALYGGAIVRDEDPAQADREAVETALEWICEMVDAGYIGMAPNREAALRRFLDGETVLFIDWTDEDARAFSRTGEENAQFVGRAYPSSTGIPVRDTQVIGVAAFATGDEQTDALLRQAAAFLARDEQAGRLLGERGVYSDGGLWLSFPGAGGGGSALRALMGGAVDAALAGKMTAQAAMQLVQEGYAGDR